MTVVGVLLAEAASHAIGQTGRILTGSAGGESGRMERGQAASRKK